MEIKFTTADFNERNAPITAKVMRALAYAAQPKVRIELSDAMKQIQQERLDELYKAAGNKTIQGEGM